MNEDRKRIQRRKEIEEEKQRKMDNYNDALQWARENGANLRKGKISKDLATYRIYIAGLMDRFNEKYPEYAFTKNDVIGAVKRMEAKDRMYADRKVLDKKTGKWVYQHRELKKYPIPDFEGDEE